MSATCWLCLQGLQGLAQRAPDGHPVATCRDCGVLACQGHAEKAKAAGKWFCLECVAVATGVHAGVVAPDASSPQLVAAVARLELNFPALAETLAEERRRFRDFGPADRRPEADEERPGPSASDAVALARYLAPNGPPADSQLVLLLDAGP